ncbi:MAG: hypothetical protein PW843_12555 [Azospirillaceae bacterium]|nr:hypothetical protein [Azospirillaceae bacterium]
MLKKAVIVVLAGSLLAGCSGLTAREQRTLSGGAIGAAGGAVVTAIVGGPVLAGAAVGAAAGAVVGAVTKP